MIKIGRFKDWLKKVIAFRKIEKEDDVENAFEQIKGTIAVALENVDDASVAATIAEILGGESPDFDIEPPEAFELPPATTSPSYRIESMPEPDWVAIRDQGVRIMKWKATLTNAIAVISMAAELISLGQVDQVLGALTVVLGNTGLTGLGGDLQRIENEIKVQELWTQSRLKLHKPTIPRERDLITMHTRGIISGNEFSETMERLGYDAAWSYGMNEAAKRYPAPSELLNMLRRGFIDDATFRKLLEFQGHTIKGSFRYLRMKEPLHSTSALITQVVKEVITPEEFYKYMALQGWSRKEAEKYWAAHWRLVSLDDLQDMRNRGLIDNEKFGEQLIRHDYPPEWIEHLTTISYKNPTLRQFRQIMEYTDLSDDEIDYALQTFGFAKEWEPVMRKFLTSRRLTNERTRMLNELETNYVKGYIDEPGFRSELSDLGLSPDVIELRIERSKLRYDREIRDDLKGIFIQAYRNDFISEQQFWEELIGLGIQGEIAEIILNQELVRKKPAGS